MDRQPSVFDAIVISRPRSLFREGFTITSPNAANIFSQSETKGAGSHAESSGKRKYSLNEFLQTLHYSDALVAQLVSLYPMELTNNEQQGANSQSYVEGKSWIDGIIE